MPLINIIFLLIVVGAFVVFGLTVAWASRESDRLAAGRAGQPGRLRFGELKAVAGH